MADTTVEFKSRLIRVTFTDVHESGYYTFENRIGKVVRFSCLWAVAATDFDPPFIYGWSARLRPHGTRTYGDSRPRDVDCAAGRSWPVSPALQFAGSTTELSNDSLQVIWYSACAEQNQNECTNTLVFVNRVHQLTSLQCVWTTDGGSVPRSLESDLAPYEINYAAGPQPDPGSLSCTTVP
jgi:hypothetical protein